MVGQALGNTRVSFTSDPEEQEFTATMETGDPYEDVYFHNIPKITSATYNKTSGGNEVMVLNSANNVGANYIAEVMPRDEIDLSVWAAYESGTGYNSTNNASTMIGLIASIFTGIPPFTDGATATNAITDAINALGVGGTSSSNKPAAYLNYYLFDKNLGIAMPMA